MSPDDLIRLRHMAEAAQHALGFVQGRQRADLDTDTMLRFALTRAVEIIGEAASKVSVAGRAAAPTIEWPVIVGMRNRLAHAYFDVNADILWNTVTIALPALLRQLRAIEGVGENTDPGAED
jgi:uncharacterized protein with HEPN domain